MAPEVDVVTARLPPHVNDEMKRLFAPYERHFKRHISANDMVGALILRARRESFGLMEDLAAYLDVEDAWKEGVIHLPES